MDTAKNKIPDDLEKTIVIDPDKTIAISEEALNRQCRVQKKAQEKKPENFTYTWFHGSRDVNSLISDENRTKLGTDEDTPIPIDGAEETDPELISVEQLYRKSRDFNGGGQGVISEQTDLALGRTIAVKSLRKELLDKPESRASFIREARISSCLEHPSIIPVYSLTGDEEKGLHLAMKLIKGMSLADYLKEVGNHYEKDGLKNFNEEKTLLYRLDLFLRICDALSYAHGRNIMHRDLKPENIIIGQYREIYVMDWGIARHIVYEPGEAKENTRTLWGTPAFIPPEMLRGEQYDQRADIYSLGMILFEMVYLKQGITGNSLQEILDNAKRSRFESFRHRFGFPVSSELTAIVKKAIHPDLSIRYQTVEDFSLDLRRYLAGEETKAKPDHFFGKILRCMNRHRKIVALLMILLVLGFIGNLAFSFYKQRNEEIYRHRYERAITQISINADTAAYEIEQQLLSLGFFLQLFCEEMEVRLKNPAEVSSERPVPFLKKGEVGKGFVYSPCYKAQLDLDHFGMFIAKHNSDEQAAQKQIEQLAPMLKKSEKRFLNTALPDTSASIETKKKKFAEQSGAMFWFYLGMENGLYLQYPASDALPETYDPRQRPWYLAGITNFSERLVWSKPYWDAQVDCLVITGTRPCRRGGKTIGVAGFDVSLAYFNQMIERYGTVSRFSRGKYILDQDGTILVAADRDSNSIWGGKRSIEKKIDSNTMLNVKNLDSTRIFEKIHIQQSGIIKQTYHGETLLYVFYPIRMMRWTYMEIVAIDEYLNMSAKSGKKD